MKIIKVINLRTGCKKKIFLEIKRVFPPPQKKIWLFLFSNLGTGHYLCRGKGEGEAKICWKDQNYKPSPFCRPSKWQVNPPSVFNTYVNPPPHLTSPLTSCTKYLLECM